MKRSTKAAETMKQAIQQRFASIAVVALMLVTLIPAAAEAKPPKFSRIIVLGDSLSDTGIFFRLTGGLPPPPNFEGRFCNGRLWVEYLAGRLGTSIAPGDNFAVVGATTGSLNVNNGLDGRDYPGIEQQVTDLLSAHPTGLDLNALYVLWAGANDFFVFFGTGGEPSEMIANGVENTVRAIQRLSSAGARHILVPNVPDIGLTPLASAIGDPLGITGLVAAYNTALAEALGDLEDAGTPVIELDSFALFQGIVTYAPQLGFTNVTESYLPGMEGDVRRFLFWDEVHPTTRAHQIISAVAFRVIADHLAHHKTNGRADAAKAILRGRCLDHVNQQ